MKKIALVFILLLLFGSPIVYAQTELQKANNLKTCISGKFPTLCKHNWLTPQEKVNVAAAEYQENLKLCLTGKFKTLCKKNLLTQSELKQVLLAEYEENLRICKTGRFPSLCDRRKLTSSQLLEVQSAERQVAESRRQYDNRQVRTSKRGFSSSGCESGHWVNEVSDDGEIVKLEDGSIWEIDPIDTIDTMLWLPTTDIVACDDKLINTEDNETVSAQRLR